MDMSFAEADEIYRAPKKVVPPLRWRPLDQRKLYSSQELTCRFEIDGGIPRGTFFRIISKSGSLLNLTFLLDCERTDGNRTRICLYRLELNPISGHANKLYGPDEVNGVFIDSGIPHEHVFYDSLKSDGELRSRPDEQGRILRDPPQNFSNALSFVCSRINITNGSEVPAPESQGTLL
jgi:hypothetical protein